MSRRRRPFKRDILPDPLFADEVVTRFTNRLMRDGKKAVAEGIIYGAFDMIKDKTSKAPLDTFHKALENVRPSVEVRSRRVGGATYQVPVEVRPDRARALAIGWLIEAARKRGDKTMASRLGSELLDAAEERGAAFRKREEAHRMAEANRAFSHYRW